MAAAAEGLLRGGKDHGRGKQVEGPDVAGKRVIVTKAEVVHTSADGQRSPCAVMQQTLMPVPKTY